jgi:hypothetical protein
MNASDPCIPWYFPVDDTGSTRMCDPWEAREFRKHVSNVPDDECEQCLPDCSGTIYKASVTAAPFRRCDYKNLGISTLCNFESEQTVNPPIWGQKVLDQYLEEIYNVTNNKIYFYQRARRALRVYFSLCCSCSSSCCC